MTKDDKAVPMVDVKAIARGYDCVSAMREPGDIFQMPADARGSWFRPATMQELSTEAREVGKEAAATAAEAQADSKAEDMSTKSTAEAAAEWLEGAGYTAAPEPDKPTLQPKPVADKSPAKGSTK